MKKDTLDRYAYIETQLYWGGGLTARELAAACNLTRQNAQGVISSYRDQHPDNIVFSPSQKRQVAGEHFKTSYISDEAGDFLDYQRGSAMVAYYRDEEDWGGLPFYDVDHLIRPQLDTGIVRIVVEALRQQRVITIDYHAKTGIRTRDVSPNHLIFAGNRYHIRAYCHLYEKHLDFVLSRIAHAEPSMAEWVSSSDDEEWNEIVELKFKPNEQLPDEVKDALLWDFPIDDKGVFKKSCRRSLAYYIEKELLAIDSRYQLARWVKI